MTGVTGEDRKLTLFHSIPIQSDPVLSGGGKLIIQGNALTELKKMDADNIDCVVTSPPYWSLRKYDIPDVIFNGMEGCEHEWKQEIKKWHSDRGNGKRKKVFDDTFQVEGTQSNFCSICGAWRGQLGLEPTFEIYLKHLLEIFDEIKRVLKSTGTMWVNLGDSYAGSWGNYGNREGKQRPQTVDKFDRSGVTPQNFLPGTVNCGIPPKSLCLIPYRFAISMINRGWINRNVLIWHKPNCMPASVKDRFTVDFEPVFFFVKNKKYWFEQQYEPFLGKDERQWAGDYDQEGSILQGKSNAGIKKTKRYPKECSGARTSFPGHSGYYRANGKPNFYPQGRNKRSVWTITTQSYPESHFATFPEDLVEPMIRAGCPKRGIVLDPFCGSGTVLRVSEKLGRQAIGIDLGYEKLAEKRLRNNQMELI